jgi:hypothetical protein
MSDARPALAARQTADGLTHVAIASTGVYWQAVYKLLDGPLDSRLVNLEPRQQFSGGQTARAAGWLADVRWQGWLRGRFI